MFPTSFENGKEEMSLKFSKKDSDEILGNVGLWNAALVTEECCGKTSSGEFEECDGWPSISEGLGGWPISRAEGTTSLTSKVPYIPGGYAELTVSNLRELAAPNFSKIQNSPMKLFKLYFILVSVLIGINGQID